MAAGCSASACCGPRWTAPKSSSAWRPGRTSAADHPARELRQQLEGILISAPPRQGDAGSAGPRDLLALGRSLDKIPALKRSFDTEQAARLRSIHERLDELPDVANLILEAIADEPPFSIADGGAIRSGFNPELDELRDLSRTAASTSPNRSAANGSGTGIQSLKVRFNNVFGYYIEITRANLHLAPRITNASRRWPTRSVSPPRAEGLQRKVLDAEEKI